MGQLKFFPLPQVSCSKNFKGEGGRRVHFFPWATSWLSCNPSTISSPIKSLGYHGAAIFGRCLLSTLWANLKPTPGPWRELDAWTGRVVVCSETRPSIRVHGSWQHSCWGVRAPTSYSQLFRAQGGSLYSHFLPDTSTWRDPAAWMNPLFHCHSSTISLMWPAKGYAHIANKRDPQHPAQKREMLYKCGVRVT
jgi:hypothetical protein